MFEKESKEYANKWLEHVKDLELQNKSDDKPEYIRILEAHQKGAVFGYKLAHEEMDYLNQHWGNGKDKANEWHYCKDELPEIKVGNCVDVEVCFLNAFDNPCKKSCYWNGKDFLYWSDKKPIGEKKVSLFGKIYAWKYVDNFFPELPKESK